MLLLSFFIPSSQSCRQCPPPSSWDNSTFPVLTKEQLTKLSVDSCPTPSTDLTRVEKNAGVNLSLQYLISFEHKEETEQKGLSDGGCDPYAELAARPHPSSSGLSQGLPHRESDIWLLSHVILDTPEEGNVSPNGEGYGLALLSLSDTWIMLVKLCGEKRKFLTFQSSSSY